MALQVLCIQPSSQRPCLSARRANLFCLRTPSAFPLRFPRHCRQFKLRGNPTACLNRTESLSQCTQNQRDPAADCSSGKAAPRRATLFAAALTAGLAACSGPPDAIAAGLTAGQAAAVQRAAGVVPALPPSSYLRLIAAARPGALRAMSAQVLTLGQPHNALPLPCS